MTFLLRLSVLATILGLAAGVPATPARADAILDVIRAYGLIGTWAADCASPASTDNWHMSYYATSAGMARRKSYRGPNENTLDGTVDSAERLTPTMLRMRLRNDDPNWGDANGRYYDTVVEVANGRARSLSSIGSDGIHYITEGKFRDGTPTSALNRCRNSSS